MRLLLSALFFVLGTISVVAQETPTDEELASRISENLPNVWELLAFRNIASVNTGDPITPKALIRFEADVAPRSDLYSLSGESIGPYDIVLKTYEGETARTLFGTMELRYSAGDWFGEPNIENPIDNLGKPIDMFTKPTLELGSERQAEVVASIRDDAISAARAKLSAQLLNLATDHEARITAKAAEQRSDYANNQRNYEARKAELARQLAETESGQLAELAALQSQFATRIDALSNESSPVIAGLQAALDLAIGDVKKANATALAELTNEHISQLNSLKQSHAKTVGEIMARQAGELTMLETGLEEKKKRLKREISESDEIIVMQEAVIEKLQTIQDNDLYTQELVAAKREDRIAFFNSFGAELLGRVSCQIKSNQAVESNYIFKFLVEKVMPNGLIGTIDLSDNKYPASLTVLGDFDHVPRKLSFEITSLNVRDILNYYELELDQTKMLIGGAEGKARSGYATVCNVSIGQ